MFYEALQSVDRETGESVGSSISSLPDECYQIPETSAQQYDRISVPQMFSLQERLAFKDRAERYSPAPLKKSNTMGGFRIPNKHLSSTSRHSSDIDITGSESSNDHIPCASRSSSVGSQTEFHRSFLQPAGTVKATKSVERPASCLLISSCRKRSVRSISVSSSESLWSEEPRPAKIARLGPLSEKKERVAWVKNQRDIARRKAALQARASASKHAALGNASQPPLPPPQVYMRQIRRQLKQLAERQEWEKALELIEHRFCTRDDANNRVLDEVMQEALQQEEWPAAEQLIELNVGRHLLNEVFHAALEKNQWRWLQQVMTRNSRDLQLNTIALHEAVKAAEEEHPILELLGDLNVECHAGRSFYEAIEKRFWRAASMMVKKQFVTQDQCRVACKIVLSETISHYTKSQRGKQASGNRNTGSGRLKSDQKRSIDMWSFLYLLAQQRINKEPIWNCVQEVLACNDWMLAKQLASLLPAECEDGHLSLLFAEALRRQDWPYIISHLSQSTEHTDDILQAAVAQGAWNYAVQIIAKTQKEAIPKPLSYWSKLEVVLHLQQRCGDDVMSSAFKLSVRKGDWEYVALLAHPSVKDTFRCVALQEVIMQWAELLFNLLTQGRGDPPINDNECMFTPTPIHSSGSWGTQTPSSSYFQGSPLLMSASTNDDPLSFSAMVTNPITPFVSPMTDSAMIKQGDAEIFTFDSWDRMDYKSGSLSSDKSRPESLCSLDDVFLPEDVSPDPLEYEWKDIREHGQYLYTIVQLTKCLSKTQGANSSNFHRELLKDTITKWAEAVSDLLQSTSPANSFTADDVCCNLLYSVEKKMDLMSTSTDATSEMAWACVQFLVTQIINSNLAQFALYHTLTSRRWDIIDDILLFGLDSFTENGRRLIFKQALEDKQWEVVRRLADNDLYEDQVKEALMAATDAHQSDLVLFLLDMQQLSYDDIQDVFAKVLQTTECDLILPLLERGATTASLPQNFSSESYAAAQKLEAKISTLPQAQSSPVQQSALTTVHQLRTMDQLSDSEQWDLLQEAVSGQKWHIAAQVIQKCSIGRHTALHRKLYPEALLQGQWGVIRTLIERGVQDAPLHYQASSLELIQHGKWSILGQVFLSCTEKDKEIFSEVLSKAVARQEWSAVVQLIQAGPTEEQRKSLFHLATRSSNWKLVEQLTKQRDSVGYYLSEYAFDIAVSQSNWDLVCHYVQQGVDVNYQDREGNTALHHALMQKNHAGANTLMDFGPDVNIMNDDQVTPMHLAAKSKAWDLVKRMIESGGNITLPDHKQVTVLKYLLEAAQADVLHFAVQHGCDVMANTVKDRTAMHVLLSAGYFQTVVQMVEQGADPNVITDRRTLLHFAVNRTTLSSMESCVSLCIELGLSTHQPQVNDAHITRSDSSNLADKLKNSPTCMALRNTSVPFKILWMLLESGASSSLELHLLKSWPQLEQIAAAGENSRQKVEYLTQAASNPGSLKHLCRLTVSHHMGYKGDRTKRIASLPLPRQLKDYVSFSDVLAVVKYQGKRML